MRKCAGSPAARAGYGAGKDRPRPRARACSPSIAAIARDVAPADDRVRGVLAVSAVALWYKAGRYDDAQQVACEFLAAPQAIDAPSRVELQELLERCWRDREARHLIGADTAFEPVEIKLAGGEIRTGVAPAGAVRERQALAQTLLMRTAELLAKKPFRVRGEASRDISRSVRIFEAPARAASYGVRLFVASGQQQPLPHILAPTPRQIVDTFLRNIDPTQNDGQFCDRGTQYRSIIFVANAEERAVAEAALAAASQTLRRTLSTEIRDAGPFWIAEDYHQQYDEKTGHESCPLPGVRGT